MADTTKEREDRMTTVLITHRVADFDAWKLAYERVAAGPLGSATRSYRIWRGQDDPQLVILEETYDSRDAAEATLNHPDLPAEIANAGVEMSSVRIDYLDEIASGTL
jgi:quinol monooxygenase YgiN